jgi:2-succinyl-6-hydroxy-2,4-cyclohexadiene-1-carboxylate synthase
MSDGPGVHLAAVTRGSGEPVVVLHGFSGSGEAMASLVFQLDGYRCVAVDLVGHGRSPSPVDLAPYGVEAMAASVAQLAAGLGDGPAHVVGYSMGGRVALALAAARPQLCRSLTLISATAGITDVSERVQRRRADRALADRIGEHGLARFVDEWVAMPMWDSLRASLSAEAWQASIDQRLRSDPTGLANSLRAGGTGSMEPLWDRLEALNVPTLVMCGELDAKFVAIGHQMHGLLPHSDLVIVPGAGHAAHLEDPDGCVTAIRRHLAAH